MERRVGTVAANPAEARVVEILRAGLDAEEVGPETDVLESGLLDSVTFVDLLVRLEEAFGVQVEVDEVELDDFRTARAIAHFLARRHGIDADGSP